MNTLFAVIVSAEFCACYPFALIVHRGTIRANGLFICSYGICAFGMESLECHNEQFATFLESLHPLVLQIMIIQLSTQLSNYPNYLGN